MKTGVQPILPTAVFTEDSKLSQRLSVGLLAVGTRIRHQLFLPTLKELCVDRGYIQHWV